MNANLFEGIQEEIERNQELLIVYESIPQGTYGATMIRSSINRAVDAVASGDVVSMIKALKELRSNE